MPRKNNKEFNQKCNYLNHIYKQKEKIIYTILRA